MKQMTNMQPRNQGNLDIGKKNSGNDDSNCGHYIGKIFGLMCHKNDITTTGTGLCKKNSDSYFGHLNTGRHNSCNIMSNTMQILHLPF